MTDTATITATHASTPISTAGSTTGPTTESTPITHEATFPLAWLAAIRLFAAEDDIRHYLKGVAISRGGLVATNGHYIALIRDEVFDGLPEIILPNAAVDDFLKAVKGWRDWVRQFPVTVRWQTGGSEISTSFTLSAIDVSCTYTSQGGKYPDYSRVLIQRPRKPDTAMQFNWAYLALYEKAAAILPKTDGELRRTVPDYDQFTKTEKAIIKKRCVLVQPCAERGGARVTLDGMPEFAGGPRQRHPVRGRT